MVCVSDSNISFLPCSDYGFCACGLLHWWLDKLVSSWYNILRFIKTNMKNSMFGSSRFVFQRRNDFGSNNVFDSPEFIKAASDFAKRNLLISGYDVRERVKARILQKVEEFNKAGEKLEAGKLMDVLERLDDFGEKLGRAAVISSVLRSSAGVRSGLHDRKVRLELKLSQAEGLISNRPGPGDAGDRAAKAEALDIKRELDALVHNYENPKVPVFSYDHANGKVVSDKTKMQTITREDASKLIEESRSLANECAKLEKDLRRELHDFL